MNKTEIINQLNSLMINEINAANFYRLFSVQLKHLGINKMSKMFAAEAVEEDAHSTDLMSRILFLGGKPEIKSKEIHLLDSFEEIIKKALKMEEKASESYRNAIEICEKDLDYGTVMLLEKILEDEEKHIDFFQQQLRLIEQIGIQNYIMQQS